VPWASNHLSKHRKNRASGEALATVGGRDHSLGLHGIKVSRLEYDRRIAELRVASEHLSDCIKFAAWEKRYGCSLFAESDDLAKRLHQPHGTNGADAMW
jgi:hypothetical protein